MTQLDYLYGVVLTRSDAQDAGSGGFRLIVNDGTERLYKGLPGSGRGHARLFRIDVRGGDIDTARLRDGSLRIEAGSDDEWHPDTIFIWGEHARRLPIESRRIIPIAYESGITTQLSTADSDTGSVVSMPLRLTRPGRSNTLIRRVLLLAQTHHDPNTDSWWPPWGAEPLGEPAGGADPGKVTTPGVGAGSVAGAQSDDNAAVEIVADRRIVVIYNVPDTPQGDLDSKRGNLYPIPVSVPFTRNQMLDDAVRLGITGDDMWYPQAVFVFGLDTSSGPPRTVVPLVHLDHWKLGPISTDRAEGTPRVVLPLLPKSILIDSGPVSDG